MVDYDAIRKRLCEKPADYRLRNGDGGELAYIVREQRDFARRVALAALDYSDAAMRLAKAWASRKSVKNGEFVKAIDGETEARAALAALSREAGEKGGEG